MTGIFKNLSETVKRRVPLKWVVIFIAVQITAVAAAFLIFGLIPVSREVKNITATYGLDKAADKSALSVNADLLFKIREREHYDSFLRSALALSKSDSISLLIDLSDSLAILSLKGVFLFQTKISEIEFNKGLDKLPVFLRDSLYSGPFMVEREFASIEKFPVVVKKAPKDTTEANADNSAPVLPTQNDVFVLLAFANNLVIEINQEEDDLAGSVKAWREYKKGYSKFFKEHNLALFKDKNAPEYLYRIKISIPREDARSIYRALPLKPFVLVRY